MTRYAFYESPKGLIAAWAMCMAFYGLWGMVELDFLEPVAVAAAVLPPTIITAIFAALYRWRRFPALSIQGTEVTLRSAVGGGPFVAHDTRDFSLVEGPDFLALRRPNRRDIVILQDRFSKQTWQQVVAAIKGLPYASVE